MKYQIITAACIVLGACKILPASHNIKSEQRKIKELDAEYRRLYMSWEQGKKNTLLLLRLWNMQQELEQAGINKNHDWKRLFEKRKTQARSIISDCRLCIGSRPIEAEATTIDALCKLSDINANLISDINKICQVHKLAPDSASKLRSGRSALMKQIELLVGYLYQERLRNHQLTQQLQQIQQAQTQASTRAELEQERRAHQETKERAIKAERNALVVMQQFVTKLDTHAALQPTVSQPAKESEDGFELVSYADAKYTTS